MPVYTRTAAGNEAALNPNSAMPRKLRTLLISIDGRTRLGTYVNSLSSFGDVEALIQSLLQAGLIQATSPQFGVPDEPAELPDNMSTKMPHPSWRSTDAGNTSWHGTQPPVDDLVSWSKFQQPPGAAHTRYTPPITSTASTASTAQYQLRNAISSMSDFVTQHMPMESLELVLTLEGLTSVEQVIGSLKGYQSLVEHLGQPARDHLAKLRTLLANN